MLTLDQALDKVGGKNFYQYKLFFTMALQFFGQGMLLMSPTYLSTTPQLQCTDKITNITTNCTQAGDYCRNSTVSIIPGYKHENIVTQLNLICDDAIYIEIAQSCLFLGSILGCLFFSYFGDHSGRRNTLLISWGVTTFGIVGIYFTFNTFQYIAFNIIAGFGVNGAFNVCFVLLNEVCETRFRQKASLALLIVFAVTEILCALFYYGIFQWKTVYLCFTVIPAIAGFLLCFTIHETPKFFLCDNKVEQAFDALDKIAISNRLPLMNRQIHLVLSLPKVNKEDFQSVVSGQSTVETNDILPQLKYGYQHLFIFKSLRKSTFGFMGMLFALQYIYYGGQYGLSSISGGENSVYLIGGSIGFAELITYLVSQFTIENLPRKMSIIISTILCLVFCSGYLFFGPTDQSITIPDNCESCAKLIVTIILACAIRMSVSVGFGVQPLYANEVYPTVIRTIGTGFVFAFGLIGSFLAPYTFTLGKIFNINPYYMIALVALMAPLSTLLIRETMGQPLEDEIEEEKNNLLENSK